MSDRNAVVEEFAAKMWPHMHLPTDRKKWAPEVRDAYDEARLQSFTRAMVAAQKEKARVIARELVTLGLLASGEVEWGVEIGRFSEARTVMRMHPNTEREARRWATLHKGFDDIPPIVVKRRLSGPWVKVEEVRS